jgi:hypothetical protein
MKKRMYCLKSAMVMGIACQLGHAMEGHNYLLSLPEDLEKSIVSLTEEKGRGICK